MKPRFYWICRWLVQAGLGFYFRRIERFHRERVPLTGPVLFTSNHPNSLTDAFIIGTAVPRKVSFVATVQIFRLAPLKWLLSRCGVIPVNRMKDDPRAMRTVMATFEACFRVLERGEAVAIFPEGITHDDPQLKALKTGAARMALELESRHNGKLGLQVVPVGLTFSAKEIYRSEALVHFGEPIQVVDYLAAYSINRHNGIQALIAEVERRIQGLILHLPQLERARIVAAVKGLYLDRLWAGNTVIHEPVPPQAGELLLTQAISRAVDFAFANHPARAAEFVRRLGHYEATLKRLRFSDQVLAHFPERRWMGRRSLAWLLLAIIGAPAAFYGWVHRLVPTLLLWLIVSKAQRIGPDKTQVSTATILGGAVVFTGFYGLYVFLFHQFFGWKATLIYASSLPVGSLAAYYYLREMKRFLASARAVTVLLRTPRAARQLLRWRAELIQLIDAEREEFLGTAAVAKAG